MDKKKILNDIKNLLTFKEEKFLDATLTDGTMVRVEGESLEVGLPLFVVTEEGTEAAPAGEHKTEDGIVVVVDETGVITDVKEAAEETETPEVEVDLGDTEDMASEEPEMASEEVEVEVDKMAEMESKISNLEKQIEDLQEIMKEMYEKTAEVAEFSTKVFNKVNDFIENAPADLEFKAIEDLKGGSDFESFKASNKAKATDSLESIKNIRKK